MMRSSSDRLSSTFIELQLKSSDFGQTILATLKVELQQGSADDILAMLRQMLADTRLDQDASDATTKDDASTCTTNLQLTVESATNASQQKADDESKLPLMLEDQSDKQDQFLDKGEEEQRNQDRLLVLKSERVQARAEYQERRDELTGYVGALQEAKSVIVGGSSFLQVKSLKDQNAKFLKRHPKQGGYHGLVSLLLDISTGPVDENNALIAVFDELIESIYELQVQELNTESERQQDYLSVSARIVEENSRLESSIAELQAKVLVIEQLLLELQNDINFNAQVVEQQNTQNSHWQKTCQDQQRAYELSTQNRVEQQQILEQCIDIFETKFEAAKSFLQK